MLLYNQKYLPDISLTFIISCQVYSYLHKLFTLFINHNISIKSIKTFLGYIKLDLLDK